MEVPALALSVILTLQLSCLASGNKLQPHM